MSMTLEKLNKLRANSQCTRDIYYLLRDNYKEGSLAGMLEVSDAYDLWQLCQQKAEAASLEWIAQGCMHHIDFGVGTVYLSGQAIGIIKNIKYGPL